MSIDQKYIEAIKAGDIVAFPTETVYGLGADAWNPDAIQKVFTIKGRPSDNPLIVHVSHPKQVYEFAKTVPDKALKLIEAFWPGPFTIIFKKKPEVLDAVTAGLDTVAIRMPDHPLTVDFISQTGPLVAPSANKSGKPSPTKAGHVIEDFGNSVLVIDGGATNIGLESTVFDLTDIQPAILRPGSISRKQVEDVLHEKVAESFFHHLKTPRSPGQKYSHYKPKAEVQWLSGTPDPLNKEVLYLLLTPEISGPNVINYNGKLDHLAKELYDRFRQADHDGFSYIAIEPFDGLNDHPVVPALLNRIEKALS